MSLYDNTDISLTITVLDTATIFEGPESIYRYDLPGTAIVEGKALAGVMEQAQKMFPAQWPEVTVAVVADLSGGPMSHEAVKIIRRQLQVQDVAIAQREPARVSTSGQEPTQMISRPSQSRDSGIIRPTDDHEGFFARLARRRGMIALVVAGLIIVILVIWMALRVVSTTSSKESSPERATTATAAAPAVTEAPTSVPSTLAAPTPETIEAGGLRVKLPEGFTYTEEDGLVTATGQDPSLRILMAIDPLYAVPANALFAEVRAQIDSDATLSNPREANSRLTYLEQPGDDSEVLWTTWVEDDQQISLGCHTRSSPTMAQRAACRMASETIERVS